MKKDSWLYSDNFFKRAFAIYGYNLAASFFIAAGMLVILILLAIALMPFRTMM